MYRLPVSVLLAAALCCTACGNTTGTAAPGSGDISPSADVKDIGPDVASDDVATADATISDKVSTDLAVVDTLPDVVAPADTALSKDTDPGTDTSLPDTSPDVQVTACVPTYEGSIPGATLDLSKTPCTFSIKAAKGVFDLGYKLTVLTSEKLSTGGNMGGCPPQPSSIHGGIATFEQLDGGGQKWCMCDTGLCAPIEPPFTASTVGSYDVAFTWDGKNFQGPSDTGNKPGPAFPPGSYVFSVTVAGKHQKADGTTETFSGVAKLPITLTP